MLRDVELQLNRICEYTNQSPKEISIHGTRKTAKGERKLVAKAALRKYKGAKLDEMWTKTTTRPEGEVDWFDGSNTYPTTPNVRPSLICLTTCATH